MKVALRDHSSRIFIAKGEDLLRKMPASHVDFCYIDPPFMTQTKRVGSKGSYDDLWRNGIEQYVDNLRHHLKLLQRVLRVTGTVMVHVDPRTSHYVKVMMDEVFGAELFINEIVWCYNSGGAGKRTLAKKHDVILFYGNSKAYDFQVVREPYPRDYGDRQGFHPDGRMLNDWWTIPIMSTTASERCGYPTQKPVELLERAIRVATEPGDMVLDFFCGSGTTAVAAKRNGRDFILGDENPQAIKHAVARINDEETF